MVFADFIRFSTPDISSFPTTRYHGSKRKLLAFLHERFAQLHFTTALDLFSGSASVSLLLRQMGKQVVANDYLPFNQNAAHLFLTLQPGDVPCRSIAEGELTALLDGELTQPPLVSDHFTDIFFTDAENTQIDRFCQNVDRLPAQRRSLYIYAVGQALLMKRPFSLFHRRNLNLRTAEIERSFGNKTTWERPIIEHALATIASLREVGWYGPSGIAFCHNTADGFEPLPDVELVYADPPYLGQGGAVDYADFYHFLTGLVDYPAFSRTNPSRRHAPILDLPTNWARQETAVLEIKRLVTRWPTSLLIFSYRSDGSPTIDELVEILSANGRNCKVFDCNYQYALARDQTTEVVVISVPVVRSTCPSSPKK